MRRLAFCLAMLLPTSCSLMFVNGPPPGERFVESGQCTQSGGWPVVDVLLALGEGARTAYAITRTDADYQGSSLSRPSDIAIGSALLALTAISAGVGFSRVSDCNDAINGTLRPHPIRRVVAPPRYTPPGAAEPSVDIAAPSGPGDRPTPAPARRPQQDDPE
jgi:hypothetical protein